MPVSQSEAPIAPKVNAVREEVTAAAHRWDIVEDCLNGDQAVKRRGRKYLPKPNPGDTSPENDAQYQNYKERAVFYNVTRRTLDGWAGQVFSREPICELPPGATGDDMWGDIDGAGSSLDQQAKLALASVMAYGRGGLLVDYPHVKGPITVSELKENYIRPTIHFYGPKAIINWRMKKVGGVYIPSLVVLRETGSSVSTDGFSITKKDQCRVLRLNENMEYTIEVWQLDDAGLWTRTEFYTMIGPNGKPVNRILFFPIGINRNSFDVDLSPTYDLAVLNIAHFRNSADYEDSCFMVGQPTPVVAGVTQEWVEDVFKGRIELGSRAVIPLPVGGNAQLLQVNPNTMTMEAMKHKEAQMVALGARIIKDNSVQKTLGESQMDEAGESSILATASKNVSMAYTMALRCCGYLMGETGDRNAYVYSLNTDFPASRLTPNERAQLVLEWQSQAISETEMRAALRRGGIATQDIEVYKKEIKDNPPPQDPDKMQQGQNGQALNQGSGGGNQASS